jgi:hypothetical protein
LVRYQNIQPNPAVPEEATASLVKNVQAGTAIINQPATIITVAAGITSSAAEVITAAAAVVRHINVNSLQ